MVNEDDDLILISNDGVIIRIAVQDVRIMSRYASGVRVMRLGENDKVVTFVRAEHADDEETSKIEDTGEDNAEDEALEKALEEEMEADEAALPEEEEPEDIPDDEDDLDETEESDE